MSKEPLVSICCLTYNHEKYINACLEGFVSQKTDFNFEVLVHDDASTDDTANVVRIFEKRYPHIIKPIYQKENQFSKGITPTIKFNFPRVKGEFIAMCEGDDCWIDPLKLQKQVDFLRNNLEYNFSVSGYKSIDENGNILNVERFPSRANALLIRDYITKRFSQTATFLFRNNFKFPTWVSRTYAFDQAIVLLATGEKKIKYHEEIFSLYRLHSGGLDTSYKDFVERNNNYILLLKNIRTTNEDWKTKLIINLKIHTTKLRNYDLPLFISAIVKIYIGFMNRIVIPKINYFLHWI